MSVPKTKERADAVEKLEAEVVRLRSEVDELRRRNAVSAEEEEKYRDLYENAPDMRGSVHAETEALIECNESLVREFGYEKQEILGRHVSFLHPADQHARLGELFEKLVTCGELCDEEIIALRKDGSRFPVSLNVSAIRDADGRVVASRSVLRDITERKRVDEALARREEHFRILAESIQVVPWHAVLAELYPPDDADGPALLPPNWPELWHPTYLGPQVETLLGYDRERCCEPGFWYHCIHSDDRAHVAEEGARAVESADSYESQYRMIAADGRVVRILDRIEIMRENDVPVMLRGVMIDVTAQRAAEDTRDRAVRELDHRVKNTLAVVQALAALTQRATGSGGAFEKAFSGRIRALGRIHEAMAGNAWRGLELADLIALSLEPFARASSFRVSGPVVELPLDAGRTIGLVMHELVANASKYGALTSDSGSVAIEWSCVAGDGGRHLHVEWAECGGPPVEEPSHTGFGRMLIQRSVAYELDGEVDLEFLPGGLRCRIALPLAD